MTRRALSFLFLATLSWAPLAAQQPAAPSTDETAPAVPEAPPTVAVPDIPRQAEELTTRLGENSRRLEVFIPTPDGGRFKAATIDYTRRSGRQAAGSGH